MTGTDPNNPEPNSADPKSAKPSIDHRKLGAQLFNETWTYLDKSERTVDEDDAMLYTAFGSRYHWAQVGAPENFARGEWLISRVYAVLSKGGEAGYHAKRCLEICQQHGIADWDIAFSYEALCRAAAISGDVSRTELWARHAYAAAELITGAEDRDLLLADLATIEGITRP
jgi:hypothetical protein